MRLVMQDCRNRVKQESNQYQAGISSFTSRFIYQNKKGKGTRFSLRRYISYALVDTLYNYVPSGMPRDELCS